MFVEVMVPLDEEGRGIVMTVVEATTEVMTVMLELGLPGVDDGLGDIVVSVPAVEVKVWTDDPGAVPVPQKEDGTEAVLLP